MTQDDESAHLNPIDTDTIKYFQDKDAKLPKSAYTVVGQSALSYSPSERVMQLSKPKVRKDHWIREDFPKDRYDPGYSGVSAQYMDLAMPCSKRVETLAMPKQLPEDYKFGRVLPTRVRYSSASPEVTFRLTELSKPKRSFVQD